MKIALSVAEKMLSAALEAAPAEACGVLAQCARCGDMPKHFREVKNVSPVEGYYEMDAASQLKAWREIASMGGTVVVVWHSHPTQPATPSPADEDAAGADESVVHVIVSPSREGSERLRGWRSVGNAMTEVPIELV